MADEVIGIILAGGKGTRLEFLTKKIAKPAVSFAAKYRIIDFPLSNLAHSGINKVGVLTQYESTLLDAYIGNGEKWGFNGVRSFANTLAPHQTEEGASWYTGTADSITQNLPFFDSLNPKYVIILSGDHIYKTTYNEMIEQHITTGADCTVSVINVPLEEASRFGIAITDEKKRIIAFEEKPKVPKSTLASMGVYVFTYKTLRKFLKEDKNDENSSHDFGKNILPNMMAKHKKIMAYEFEGYWKDVGTIASLHEANMDICLGRAPMDLYSHVDPIYTEDTYTVPQYIGKKAKVTKSIVNQGAIVLGHIDSCVISSHVLIEENTKLNGVVVMDGAIIHSGAKINNAIIAPNVEIEEGREINLDGEKVVLVSK